MSEESRHHEAQRGDINWALPRPHHESTLLRDMPLALEEYVFDPRPQFPFLITTKYYPNLSDEQNGHTLIFTHGNGLPSELWEPVIGRIFAKENAKPGGLCIRDAWAIDAPNHGGAAALNVALLESGAYDHLCESFRWWLPCKQ